MRCRVCGGPTTHAFNTLVLGKYDVEYAKCNACGFLQAEDPYWLDEAYSSAVTASDTGLLQRNRRYSKIISVLLYLLFDKQASYLDWAGGYGILTRMLRDVGFDFYWSDPYCQNLFARGFEYDGRPVTAVTCVEAFEHFAQPCHELDSMLQAARNVVFTTALLPSPVPDQSWWYYAFAHGQHIGFYSLETLEYVGRRLGLSLYSNGRDIHMLTERKIPPRLFRMVPRLSGYGLYHYVCSQMQSRTQADHLLIMGRAGEGQPR